MENSPSIRLALEAAQRMGHEALLVHPEHCHLPIGVQGVRGVVAGAGIFHPELIVTRMGSSAPDSAMTVLRHLELAGFPCVNSASALSLCRDKTRAGQRLAERGIPMPATVLLGPKAFLEQAVEIIPGPPWILKLPVSSKGGGVTIADSYRSLKATVDVLLGLGHDVLLQEAIEESQGRDLRVVVLGGVAVAAMERRAVNDEFRSNLHLGGVAESVVLTEEIRDLAERAASALDVEVAGVDILQSRRGPLVIEVNGSPGLEGIGRASGRDVAAEVIAYAVAKVHLQ